MSSASQGHVTWFEGLELLVQGPCTVIKRGGQEGERDKEEKRKKEMKNERERNREGVADEMSFTSFAFQLIALDGINIILHNG